MEPLFDVPLLSGDPRHSISPDSIPPTPPLDGRHAFLGLPFYEPVPRPPLSASATINSSDCHFSQLQFNYAAASAADARPAQPSNGPSSHAASSLDLTFSNALASFQSVTSSQSPPDQTRSGHSRHVGPRGRRATMPSGSRRTVSATPTMGARNAGTPIKDADGKFPCPHCTKTYLHVKHLKRHLLRHTGDRPYQCLLCKDTFSRSDILKRHFQKCSIRRGNPDGLSHLNRSQERLPDVEGIAHDLPPVNRMSHLQSVMGRKGREDDQSQPESSSGSIIADHTNYDKLNISSILPGTPRANHTDGGDGGSGRDSLLGPGLPGPNQVVVKTEHDECSALLYSDEGDSQDQGHKDSVGSFNETNPLRPPELEPVQSYTSTIKYECKGGQFGATSSAPEDGMDCDHSFHTEARTPLSNSNYSPDTLGDHVAIKAEPFFLNQWIPDSSEDPEPDFFSGLFQGIPVDGELPSIYEGGDLFQWSSGTPNIDPIQNKVDRLWAFCFPNDLDPSAPDAAVVQDLKRYFTADNVKHFIECFTNWQGHWPMIHTPTFNITEAYDGLVLGMVCIGAVYSDRMDINTVRQLMDSVRSALERHSRFLSLVPVQGSRCSKSELAPLSDIEEIQAWIMIYSLALWHGSLEQRELARNQFVIFADMTRRAKLLDLAALGDQSYSTFHHQESDGQDESDHEWNWALWAEQETRIRATYLIWLIDLALVIYFNCTPKMNSSEIRLPLPADDAAWEARTSTECANALGLYGPEAQRENLTGSRRATQLDWHTAMETLLHPIYELPAGSTNVYSKFLLIHSLLMQVWHFQGLVRESRDASATNRLHRLKMLTNALGKWKKSWDEDMAAQYPTSAMRYRRFGFCRDGVHFYWLSCAFLRGNLGVDRSASPERRLLQMLNLLKKVRLWVSSDGAKRGEELGSVGDIDDSYGVEDLTLDMKLLFKPRNENIDSPVPGVETDIGGALV